MTHGPTLSQTPQESSFFSLGTLALKVAYPLLFNSCFRWPTLLLLRAVEKCKGLLSCSRMEVASKNK